MRRVHLFNTQKFIGNSIYSRIEIGFLRSSSLSCPPLLGSPCLELVLGLRHSPPYGRRRAAETPVLRGLLLQPSLDRRTEVVIEFRMCASTTRCFTCGTITHQGANTARGCKGYTASSTTFAGTFPAQRTTPEVCYRMLLCYSNTAR